MSTAAISSWLHFETPTEDYLISVLCFYASVAFAASVRGVTLPNALTLLFCERHVDGPDRG